MARRPLGKSRTPLVGSKNANHVQPTTYYSWDLGGAISPGAREAIARAPVAPALRVSGVGFEGAVAADSREPWMTGPWHCPLALTTVAVNGMDLGNPYTPDFCLSVASTACE